MTPDSPKRFQEIREFLPGFIEDLNKACDDGAVVLVEGKRDVSALLALGLNGRVVTLSELQRNPSVARGAGQVVVMTDLDREGRSLASRCIRTFSGDGVRVSLGERRRLAQASRGVFLHIENLKRFAPLSQGPVPHQEV